MDKVMCYIVRMGFAISSGNVSFSNSEGIQVLRDLRRKGIETVNVWLNIFSKARVLVIYL